jgi:hypothetical protein
MAFKKRHKEILVSTFTSLHDQLVEIEAVIADAQHPADFSRHVNDLSPEELSAVADYISQLRGEMRTCLEEAGVPIEKQPVGLRWALQTAINAIDVAVAEMSPHRLSGYGSLNKEDEEQVAAMQERLHRLDKEINVRLGGHAIQSGSRGKQKSRRLHSRYV